VLLALLVLARCSFIPEKATSVKASNGPRIVIGDMLGGCNKLVTRVNPVYPREAKRRRTQGTVRLRAVITKAGELSDIQVVQGDRWLVPAALAAARQWRYAPCLLNSEPVEVFTSIDTSFNLNQ
jgi:TonB family protein